LKQKKPVPPIIQRWDERNARGATHIKPAILPDQTKTPAMKHRGESQLHSVEYRSECDIKHW
jgi:hypothetical protein